MNMKIRALSLFAAACLTATTLGNQSTSSAAVGIGGAIAVDQLSTKITEELQAVLDKSQDDDMIPVYIWTNDIDYNMVESMTVQATGLSKDAIMKQSSDLYEPLTASLAPDVMVEAVAGKSVAITSSEEYEAAAKITKADTLSLMQNFYSAHKAELAELSDTVDMYVDTRRSFAREAYNEQNGGFVNNYLKDAKIIFQSQYSPMIICEISKSTIMHLSTLNNVESLSLYERMVGTDEGSIDTNVKSIKGDYPRDNLGFDGGGVKVGQIESGKPNGTITELSQKSIVVNPASSAGTTDHASLVASIMVGSTGMAPQAELYCAPYTNFYSDAEWLVSKGVSVINISFGLGDGNTYDTYAQWTDHIVNQHGVSVVKSSGNNGTYVTSPGNAYNVITVGGIDTKGTVSSTDDTFYTRGRYTTGSGMPSKPDVVAPAFDIGISTGYSSSGTSFAAPHVTGMIAQMMSFCPTLKFRPDAIKAAVVASCDRKTSGESISSITNKEGSGVVNAINAANSISNVSVQETYYLTSGSSITFDFYPLTTGTKTIAIAWLKRNTGSGTNHTSIYNAPFVDFDLYVKDINGNTVYSSTSSFNSVEMVRFNATTTNKYTVEIKRVTSGTSTEKISLAHVRD